MKRVLFFTHSLVGGGAEKTIINLSEYINKNVKEIESYICVVYDNEKVHTETSNVVVLQNKTSQGTKKLFKIPVILRQIKELKKIKKDLNIDVCISFLPGADFLNVWSRGKEKVIVSVRNKESFFASSILKKMYVKTSYIKSDLIVAISERVKYDVINSFGIKAEKVKVIYNPAPNIMLSGKIDEEFSRMFETKRVIINAGRLTEQKGQRHLIKAFSEVVKVLPDAHLVILGSGELEDELKKLVEHFNISDKVHFTGFVYNPYDFISKAEIFVFSSIVEGLGNVLIETMACRVPIISTDCDCGPRELLAPGTDLNKSTSEIEFAEFGVLVPTCNDNNVFNCLELIPNEILLSKAILELLGNIEILQNYKDKSGERIKDFSIEKVINEWSSII